MTVVTRNDPVELMTELPARRRISRVLDHIARHPELPLTTAELARVAGVSVRALQDAFQKELGVSPMAYVRSVRLERVHADLVARATEVSITEVATRWGFYHLSRFAGHYKRRFGVLPSVTHKQAIAQHPSRAERIVAGTSAT